MPFNAALTVDTKIRDALSSERPIVVVLGCKYSGKSQAADRLKACLPGVTVIDIPGSAGEEDYKQARDVLRRKELTDGAERRKIAIFMSHRQREYFESRSKREDPQRRLLGRFSRERSGLFDSNFITEIRMSVTPKEADDPFLMGYIGEYGGESGGPVIYKNLPPELKAKILERSHYSEKEYETFVPTLIQGYARHLCQQNGRIRDAIGTEDEKVRTRLLNEGFQEEKLALEIKEQHRRLLATAFGIEIEWFSVVAGVSFETAMNAAWDVVRPAIESALSLVVPGSALLLGAGLGIARGLWKHKHGGEDAALLGGLVDASSHWSQMDDGERRFFCYVLERKREIEPDKAFDALSGLFGPGQIDKIENYVRDHAKEILESWETTPAAKALLDHIDEFGKRLDGMEQTLADLNQELAALKRQMAALKRELTTVKDDVAQLKLEGSVELTFANVSARLGVKGEDVVGLGSGEVDAQILDTAADLIQSAESAPVIISAEPGAGKTTMLYLISKRLMDGNIKVRLIENIKEFRLTREYTESHPGEYLVFEATDVSQAMEFLEKLNPYLKRRGELPRVIAAVRTHHLEDYLLGMESSSRQAFESIRHRLAYSPSILGGIVDKLIGNYSPPADRWPAVRTRILERCEGSPFYISQALTFLESKGFTEEASESLPQGVRELVVEILYDVSENDSRQLVAYYVISRYNHLPERLARAMKGNSGLGFTGNERFYTKVGDEVHAHGWYRDVFQEIVAKVRQGKDDTLADRFKDGIEDSKQLYLDPSSATGENGTAERDWRDADVEDKLEAIAWGLLIRVFKAQLDIDPYVGVARSVKGDKGGLHAALLGFALHELFADVSQPDQKLRKLMRMPALYLPRLIFSPVALELGREVLGRGDSTPSLERLISLRNESTSAVDLKCIALVTRALLSLERIGIDPEDHGERARLFILLQMYDRAIMESDEAIRLSPTASAYHYNKASALSELGRFEEAWAESDLATRLSPGDAKYHGKSGNALFDMGRFEEALAEYDLATRLSPGAAQHHSNRGNALSRLGRLEEALAEYDQAIRLNSGGSADDDAMYHDNKGITLSELGRFEEALAEYDYAIQINPTDPSRHYSKSNVLSKLDRLEEALAESEQAIRLGPRTPDSHASRGNVLYKMGRLEEALAEYDEAIRLHASEPGQPFSGGPNHESRSTILLGLGRLDEALAESDLAIRLNPGDPAGNNGRGIVLCELGRLKEALPEFEKAIRLKQNDPRYHNNKGVALSRMGRYEEALVEYGEAMRLSPPGPEYHGNRGSVLFKLGRLEESLVELEEAMRLNSSDPEVHSLRGEILSKLGRDA